MLTEGCNTVNTNVFKLERYVMTLTVRLDPTLATALDRYCADTGTSKSHVVQESLAAYLIGAARPDATLDAKDLGPRSPAFKAFADAGLVGAVDLDLPGSADKAAVRARVTSRGPSRRAPA
jgi:predicted transcriptional regulator